MSDQAQRGWLRRHCRGADCAALSCLAAIPSLEEALLCVDNPYRRSAAPCVQLRALTPLLQSPQLADLLLWAGAMQPLLSAARRLLVSLRTAPAMYPAWRRRLPAVELPHRRSGTCT